MEELSKEIKEKLEELEFYKEIVLKAALKYGKVKIKIKIEKKERGGKYKTC
ncbi:MAG: hypothetical protein LE180_06540 [Endomicrobium sp.]|uniref:hypothetical protein n=1 Tax=Candidatus Endomicrobiellum pyrsonymphae TaxID=1408203 RepID=UPI00357BE623|nr:hypothetical protein [Endomicrobium sp.]